jgi:deoxyribonuclease-4
MAMRLGAHESIAGGMHKAIERAQSVGCDAVQLFVKANRVWAAKALTDEEVAMFREAAAESGVRPQVGHASYLLNLASPDDGLWAKSRDTLIVEMQRCERLGLRGLVLHPGSHRGAGEEAGLGRIAHALGEVHAATHGFGSQVLLETTSGGGHSLGHTFEHLAWLLDATPDGERLGICLDTCHVFTAGYELRTAEGYEATIEEFDQVVGLDRLSVIHLNDSKGELGSHRDRHEHIGDGHIGLDGFRNLLNDPRLSAVPGLLETPKSDDLHEDRANLDTLRSLVDGPESSDG